MKIKRFFAEDIRQAMRMVKDELGNDAVIMSNRSVEGGVEIVAAQDFDEQLVHENLKKQQQQKRTEAARKSAELANLEAQSRAKPKTLKSPRRDLNESRHILQNTTARSKLDEYVGYAEKVDFTQGHSAPLKRQALAKKPKMPAPVKKLNPAIKKSQTNGLQQALQQIKDSMATATSDMLQEMRLEMRKEVSNIKTALESSRPPEPVVNEQFTKSPVRLDLLRRLANIGLSKKLSIKIANRLDNHKDSDVIWNKALDMLRKVLPVDGGDILKKGGVVALVGPTGVGKTTTVAKLAAQFILHYGSSRDIALITMDNYRIGAHEQLSIYGRILGVPVRVATDAKELYTLVESFRNKRLVLIDTAGVSQKDQRMLEQMSSLHESGITLTSYLVLSATTQIKAMAEIIEGFSVFDAKACILTKMDETAETGNAVSTLIEYQLPVAFITDGQQVPEDIHEANADMLIDKCLAESESDEDLTESDEWLAAGYA